MGKLITIYHGSEKNLEQPVLQVKAVLKLSGKMYEQRNKNINKANADTIYRLAKALGCTMEDLIER